MQKFQIELNNKYINTEAFHNFSSMCLQEFGNFFKETELKRLIEILLVILIIDFYQDCPFYLSLLNGNAFQWFEVCHFYLIVT